MTATVSLKLVDAPDPKGLDDATLMQHIAAGDRKAFAAFADRYFGKAFATAWRMLGDRMLAEDLAQETLLRVWQHAGRFHEGSSVPAWFYTIVTRLAIDAQRKRREYPGLDSVAEPMDKGASPEAAASARQTKVRVTNALQKLPENRRTALVLFHFDNLPQKQVAEAMGLSESAVQSLLIRGRKQLAELLKDE